MPIFVHVDKDMAEIGMSRMVWTNAKIQICWWHLRRAVHECVSKTKLSTTPYSLTWATKEFPFIDITFIPPGQCDPKEHEGGHDNDITTYGGPASAASTSPCPHSSYTAAIPANNQFPICPAGYVQPGDGVLHFQTTNHDWACQEGEPTCNGTSYIQSRRQFHVPPSRFTRWYCISIAKYMFYYYFCFMMLFLLQPLYSTSLLTQTAHHSFYLFDSKLNYLSNWKLNHGQSAYLKSGWGQLKCCDVIVGSDIMNHLWASAISGQSTKNYIALHSAIVP